MLRDLRIAVEEALQARVAHAIVTSLDSIRLTGYEIDDVLDSLRITNAMAEPDELYSISAAYAGLGYGLCEPYTEPYTCEREEFAMSEENVLAVDFSDAALRMTIKGLQSFTHTGAHRAMVEPKLGLANGASDKDMEGLFKSIGTRMRRFVQEARSGISMVLVTGT